MITLTPEWFAAIAALLSAAVAVVAAVVGPIVTVRMTNRQLRESREIAERQMRESRDIAQRQINASVVSTSRQNWINSLRDAIADLLAAAARLQQLMASAGGVTVGTPPDPLPYIEKAILLRSRIALLINPLEEDHKNLVILVDELINVIGVSHDPAAVKRAGELKAEITKQGQAILKREWERVKEGEPITSTLAPR